MRVVWHDQPQSMSWCLQCHRHPEEFVGPQEKVYDLKWKPASHEEQLTLGRELAKQWNLNPPVTCAGCHR
jgi:hypothetical protein